MLLDPGNWTISNAANSGNNQNVTDLATQLNAANVTIDTTNATFQPGNLGDITLVDALSWTGAGSLTLNAQHDVNIDNNVTSTFAGNGSQGALSVNVPHDFNMNNAAISMAGGDITVNNQATTLVNSSITTGGNITLNNSSIFSNNIAHNLNAGGTISLRQNAGGYIQVALDAIGTAGGKASVVVGDGTYAENVRITKSVSLTSQNGNGVTKITGVAGVGQTGTVSVANGVTNVIIGGANHGFTVSGVDNGAPVITNAAISLEGGNDGSVISGNAISSTGLTNGVYVNASNNVTIGGATAADGNVINNTGNDGIRLEGGSNLTVTNNSVDHSNAVGIRSNGVNTINISNNSVSNSNTPFDGAITVSSGSNATIDANTIVGSNRHGIFLDSADGINVIDSNMIDDVATHGIYVQQSAGTADFSKSVIVTNNKIGLTSGSNTGSGISTNQTPYAQIGINTIQNFHVGVNVNTNSVGTLIHDNTIAIAPSATGIIVDTGSNNARVSNNVINGTHDSFGIVFGNSVGGSSDNDHINNTLVGIRLDNAQNTAITNAQLDGNGIGIYGIHGSGGTTVGSSSFSNGAIGVFLENPGTDLAFSNNGSSFTTIGTYYRLGQGAMNGQTLDASQQTYEVVRAVDFTTAQYNAARAKTIDSATVTGVGFVFYGNPPPAAISQDVLDQLLERNVAPLRDVFSYAGKTVDSTYVLTPYNFRVETLNLSLLSPSAGTPAPVTAGAIPAGTSLGNLSPSAGGNTDSPPGTALASLTPSAGGSVAENCGNGFLSNGLSSGSCGQTQ